MKTIAATSLLALGLSLSATSASADTPQAVLAAKYQLSEKAFAENDVKVLLEQFYAKDVYVVGEDSQPIDGAAALAPVLKQLVEGAKRIELSSERANYQSDDTIYDFVNYRVFPSDGSADFNVRSLLVWKKANNDWRVSADMYTFGQYK